MQLTWCLILDAEEHQDNLFGDINMVNGVPWPVMTIQAKYHRFRVSCSVQSAAVNVAADGPCRLFADAQYITV